MRADGRRGIAEQLAEIRMPPHIELRALGRCKNKLMLRSRQTSPATLRVEVGSKGFETALTARHGFAEALLPVYWSVRGLRKSLRLPDGPLTLVVWDAQGQETVYQVHVPAAPVRAKPLSSDLTVSREGDSVTISGPFVHADLRVFDGDRPLPVRPHARFSHSILVDTSATTLRLVGATDESEATIETAQ